MGTAVAFFSHLSCISESILEPLIWARLCLMVVAVQVLEAAVIAMTHEHWGERPLLIVVPKQATGEALPGNCLGI